MINNMNKNNKITLYHVFCVCCVGDFNSCNNKHSVGLQQEKMSKVKQKHRKSHLIIIDISRQPLWGFNKLHCVQFRHYNFKSPSTVVVWLEMNDFNSTCEHIKSDHHQFSGSDPTFSLHHVHWVLFTKKQTITNTLFDVILDQVTNTQQLLTRYENW